MATRYWVGGTGAWSDTSRWSTTSGGAGGASVPGSADDAVFDANSGGGTVTTGSPSVLSIDLRGFTGDFSATGAVISLGGGTSYLISGVSGLSSAMLNCTGTTLYGGSATVANLYGSVTVASDITATILDNTYGAAISLTVNSGITVTAGRIYAYNSNFSCTGSGKIRLTGVASQRIINAAQVSGSMSFYVDCLIELVGVSTTETLEFTNGTYTYGANGEFRFVRTGSAYLLLVKGTSATVTNSLPNVHIYPETTGPIQLTVQSNVTAYIRSLQSTAGSSGKQNSLVGAAGGNIVTSVASAAFNSVNALNINVTGQAVSGTRVGDCSGNSGITFTPSANVYRIATGAYDAANSWSTSSGGAANADTPLPQDIAVFDTNTPVGTNTIGDGINTLGAGAFLAGFSARTYAGTIVFTISALGVPVVVTSTVVFGPSTTVSMGSTVLLAASAATVMQIECPNGGLSISCGNASLNAASNLTISLSATSGTLDTNNYAHTINLSTSSGVTVNFGSSAITLTGMDISGPITTSGATFTTFGTVDLTFKGQVLPNLTIASNTTFRSNANVTTLTHSSGNVSVVSGRTLTVDTYVPPALSVSPPSLACLTVGSTFTFSTTGVKAFQNLVLQGVNVSGTSYWTAINCKNAGYNSAYIIFNYNSGAIVLF